jgi:hypothetical protein
VTRSTIQNAFASRQSSRQPCPQASSSFAEAKQLELIASSLLSPHAATHVDHAPAHRFSVRNGGLVTFLCILRVRISFSLIIVCELATALAAMVRCCLLAHGERRLGRVVSNLFRQLDSKLDDHSGRYQWKRSSSVTALW